MKKPIYLDYAATTPVDPRVVTKMQQFLTADHAFGNPASQHVYGREAKAAVEEARAQVAEYLHAEASEVIWTSGATESNNLAIKGAAYLYQGKGKHLITMKTEHKSVLDPCQHLEKEGFNVTYLLPLSSGRLDLNQFIQALRPDTILVSIMHVNNETGVIQDLEEITRIVSAKNILLHVDAAQSVGKLPLDVRQVPINFISLSAHKVYGPKGIGALFLRKKPRVRVQPFIHGGGHEQGMRSGTLPTHQIVGMGEALRLAKQEAQQDDDKMMNLRERFLQGLMKINCCRLNTDLKNTVPHITSVRFDGMIADAILAQLPQIATSTASACQAKGTEGSHVLRAMGFSEEQAKGAIRFSIGRFTTQEEIDFTVNFIQQIF